MWLFHQNRCTCLKKRKDLFHDLFLAHAVTYGLKIFFLEQGKTYNFSHMINKLTCWPCVVMFLDQVHVCWQVPKILRKINNELKKYLFIINMYFISFVILFEQWAEKKNMVLVVCKGTIHGPSCLKRKLSW